MFRFDICVIGGCGRVGLPLSIAFAAKGLNVVIYDIMQDRLEMVKQGIMPFREKGCDEKLKTVIGKTLTTADDPRSISESRFIIVTIGTPIDSHLRPDFSGMLKFFKGLLPWLTPGQNIILRSTVYPGTSERINRLLAENNTGVCLAFCPERIAEGKALSELTSIPQIVSAFDEQCLHSVSDLFRVLTEDIIVLQPMEAELAKLFINSWRYLQFSIANQFFQIANDSGLDYSRIHDAITYRYPRMHGLPRPGFAAGPCLLKDTMQLAAFRNNDFVLGHAAMIINEGLPNYIVQKMKDATDLADKSVGILGMAFKANSDDERDSLSFKLKALLEAEARNVYCSDPYVKRDYFVDPEYLINICDVIILATPHDKYRNLIIPDNKMLVDIWNMYGRRLIYLPRTAASTRGDHGNIIADMVSSALKARGNGNAEEERGCSLTT